VILQFRGELTKKEKKIPLAVNNISSERHSLILEASMAGVNLSKVVHTYRVERGWSAVNEHT
jgi:hypothetical protein